jgi:hypothetical protein
LSSSAGKPSGPALTPGQVKAESARLAKRLQSLNRHLAGLELAIAEFDGDLDPGEWQRAFGSGDPEQLNRCVTVTGGFSALINGYVEMLKAAARLVGLTEGRKARTETALELIVADNGLRETQSDLIQELYVLEGRMQHVSPDVNAAELRDAILQLRDSLPSLVKDTVHWLSGHGVTFED